MQNLGMEFARCAKQAREYTGDGVVYIEAIIPSRASLSHNEKLEVDVGGAWPVRLRLVEVPGKQCRFIEALVELSMAKWVAK